MPRRDLQVLACVVDSEGMMSESIVDCRGCYWVTVKVVCTASELLRTFMVISLFEIGKAISWHSDTDLNNAPGVTIVRAPRKGWPSCERWAGVSVNLPSG